MSNLASMMNAESVAIVGISGPDKFGGQVYSSLRAKGYEGRIYGVNPRYEKLYDMKIYPSLRELPERPDCAVISLSGERLLNVFREASELSIPSAVIFANAHEDINGVALQEQLKEIAEKTNMAVCGPNGMGIISAHRKLALLGYPVPENPAGNITFISHSGSIWDSVRQNNRNINFNYIISSGNEMVTNVSDYMQFALSEPTTKVIGLFLETVRDPDGFCKALELAADKGIPVVVLKVGRSQQAARFAQAHSGALVGEDSSYDALFDYYGVNRVRSMDEMMDSLELFQSEIRPHNSKLSAMLDSGGERSLLVDLADDIGIEFAQLGQETISGLEELLEPGLKAENPLDAFSTDEMWEQVFTKGTIVMDSDSDIGLNTWCVDLFPMDFDPPNYDSMMHRIKDQLRKPFAVIANVSSVAADFMTESFRKEGIPVLMGTETALRAVKHLFNFCEFQREHHNKKSKADAPAIDDLPSAKRITEIRERLKTSGAAIEELESKHILAEWGIRIPGGKIVDSLHSALEAAAETDYPIVLKTAAGAAHKTEVKGIYVGISNDDELTEAYNDLASRLGPQVLVQEMVPDGVELILGMVNDAQFGPQLIIGIGGVLVELLKDSKLIHIPASKETIKKAVLDLKFADILKGFRGQDASDLEAIVETAFRLTRFISDCGDLIAELDINPLITGPDGAVVVDALIIPKSANKE